MKLSSPQPKATVVCLLPARTDTYLVAHLRETCP